MASTFHLFASAVRARFDDLSSEMLFVVNSDRDAIWQAYLDAFPEGTNPIFRERTEHDCSCCRAFIRDIGAVVAIQNGAVATVWDLNGLPHPYQTVADAMSEHVKALAIRDVFLTKNAQRGTEKSIEIMNGATHEWRHFAVRAPQQFITSDVDTKQGDLRTTFAVLKRGVTELTPEAIATVADLIADNAIYRGAEFKAAVNEFRSVQSRVMAAPDESARDLVIWSAIGSPAARFRNTVIGTLVQDLSSGDDLDRAVRAYETKVAPTNYKRPKALITKAMVEQAMKTIHDLGLEHALERRHARLSDVSVNSVLFVDNSVQGKMKGGIEGLLMKEVKPAPFDPDKAEEIGVDRFVAEILPKTTGLQAYLENTALGNFVSLTAPVHEDSKSLFRWGNDFAWSYDGDVADSIKERVKRAGGMVEGVAMRVSLAWSNFDDLDIHVVEPSGNHVYYGNKSGKLDVDMNAGSGTTREPVENVRWVRPLSVGRYQVFVHNYHKRESTGVGFAVEIELGGVLRTFRHERMLGDRERKAVFELMIASDGSANMTVNKDGIVVGDIAQEKWGIRTLSLVKVNSVVLSPNHWDEDQATGNKHWFFLLDGCKNPLPTRGIYNEFLAPGLEKHRKVFEVLGDKTKCPVVDEQLSGIGFSSTKSDRLTVVAVGPKLNKAYTIVFGKDGQ